MSKLSKFLRSDAGQLLASVGVAYAKKQSADERKAGPIVDVLVGAVTQEKQSDPLVGTIYAQNKIPEVTIMAETPQITPVKNGTQTSSFKLTGIVVALIPIVPVLLGWLQEYALKLPDNSVPAVILGMVIAVGQYLYTRYKTTTGEREASAQAIAAQAVIANAQAQATIAVTQAAPSQNPVENVEDDYEPVPG